MVAFESPNKNGAGNLNRPQERRAGNAFPGQEKGNQYIDTGSAVRQHSRNNTLAPATDHDGKDIDYLTSSKERQGKDCHCRN